MNKKSYEKYIAHLIKESEHRVLNERELLHLIKYTEASWEDIKDQLNTIGQKARTWGGDTLDAFRGLGRNARTTALQYAGLPTDGSMLPSNAAQIPPAPNPLSQNPGIITGTIADMIPPRVKKAADTIKSGINRVLDDPRVAAALDAVSKKGRDAAVSGIGRAGDYLVNAAEEEARTIGGGLKAMGQDAGNAIKTFATDTVPAYAKGKMDQLGSYASDQLGKAKDAAGTWVRGKVDSAKERMTGAASDAWEKAKQAASGAASRAGEKSKGSASTAFNKYVKDPVTGKLLQIGRGVEDVLNNPGQAWDRVSGAIKRGARNMRDLATGQGIGSNSGISVKNNALPWVGVLSESVFNNIFENTIIKNGKPIKQKPILSEAEELELVNNLFSEGLWDWIQNKWDDFQARNTLRNMNPEFYRQLQNSFDPGISPEVRRIVNPGAYALSQKYPSLFNQYAQLANGNNIDSYITALSQHMGISPDEVVARLQASGQSSRGTRGGRGNGGARSGRQAQAQRTPATQTRIRPRWDRFRNPRRVLRRQGTEPSKQQAAVTGQVASPVAAAPQSQVSIPAIQKRGPYANIDYSAMLSESTLLRSFWINENSNLCKESISAISPRNMYQLYLIKESLSPELLARIAKGNSNIAKRIKDTQIKA